MPAKHVHFAPEAVSYDMESLPSPTTSISSLPSSTGPITPPTNVVPLPSTQSNSKAIPALNPLLVVSKPRAVNFDASQHPSHISTPYASLSSRNGLLLEPAVTPPSAHLTLTCPHLPWYITVRPMANGAYVTVSDVLDAIYNSLRKNVTSAEFNTLPGKKAMERVNTAYQARYRRIQDRKSSEQEKKGGVKRIDFLMESRYLAGLSKGTSNDTWIMNMQS